MSTKEEILKEKFEELANEVKEFVTVNAALLEETGVYRGTQILYSPLRYKPKFLLIGINPGPGYFNKYGKNVEKFFDTEKNSEFFEEFLHLSEQTKKLFEISGCKDIFEESSVKTNCIFLATENTKGLELLQSKRLYENRFAGFFAIFNDWQRRLIEMINPDIIICKGKKSFDRITTSVLDCRIENGNGYLYATTDTKIPILGYAGTLSNTKNKEYAAAKIKELVEATNK